MNDSTKLKISNSHSQKLISIKHVQIYFSEKGLTTKEAIEFYSFYLSVDSKDPSKWKAAAFRWILKASLTRNNNLIWREMDN